MRFPKKTPGEGQNCQTHWSNERLKGGGVVNGWLAGDTVWVMVHRIGVSKPCRREMTNSVIPCPVCARGKLPELKGYVPIWREDGAPIFVIIPEYNADGLHGVITRQAVKAFRGKGTGDPIRVSRDKTRPDYHPPHAGRAGEADLEPALLRIWADDTLTTYFSGSQGGVASAASVPPGQEAPAEEARHAVDDESKDRLRKWFKGKGGQREPSDPPLVGDVLPLTTKPGLNGKGKHE